MKKNKDVSTCVLTEADVAFFPMLNMSLVENLFLPLGHESIFGLAELPPVVVNRIKIFNQNGKTFFSKNIPLDFSFFPFDSIFSEDEIEDFWNEKLLHIEKGGFPITWIIAPEYICEYISKGFIRGEGRFYYHNPAINSSKKHYYLLSGNNPNIELLDEKYILSLS